MGNMVCHVCGKGYDPVDVEMGMSAAQADAALANMRVMDTSPGSAVCENCIHMFR